MNARKAHTTVAAAPKTKCYPRSMISSTNPFQGKTRGEPLVCGARVSTSLVPKSIACLPPHTGLSLREVPPRQHAQPPTGKTKIVARLRSRMCFATALCVVYPQRCTSSPPPLSHTHSLSLARSCSLTSVCSGSCLRHLRRTSILWAVQPPCWQRPLGSLDRII